MFTPGVPVGTMNIDARRAAPLRDRHRHDDQEVRVDPFEVNHLWPLIT